MYASAVESEPPDTMSSTGVSAFASPRRSMQHRAAASTSLGRAAASAPSPASLAAARSFPVRCCSAISFPTYIYGCRYMRSMSAMVSMWSVCGNMSTGCTVRTP